METQLRSSSSVDAIMIKKGGQKRMNSSSKADEDDNNSRLTKIRKKKGVNSGKLFDSGNSNESCNKKTKASSLCSDVEVNEGLSQSDETIDKRLKKRKEKKNHDNANDCIDQEPDREETSESKVSQRNEKAFAYLDLWKYDKSRWKFQKITQSWLITNVFDIEKVPEKYFKIFLEYAIGMQGRAKEIIAEKSHGLIRKYEILMKEEVTESEDSKTEEQRYFRARSLLQHLN